MHVRMYNIEMPQIFQPTEIGSICRIARLRTAKLEIGACAFFQFRFGAAECQRIQLLIRCTPNICLYVRDVTMDLFDKLTIRRTE